MLVPRLAVRAGGGARQGSRGTWLGRILSQALRIIVMPQVPSPWQSCLLLSLARVFLRPPSPSGSGKAFRREIVQTRHPGRHHQHSDDRMHFICSASSSSTAWRATRRASTRRRKSLAPVPSGSMTRTSSSANRCPWPPITTLPCAPQMQPRDPSQIHFGALIRWIHLNTCDAMLLRLLLSRSSPPH